MGFDMQAYKAIKSDAGLGVTKAFPRELLLIIERPIIEHLRREAINGGINETIFVIRSGKEAIENY